MQKINTLISFVIALSAAIILIQACEPAEFPSPNADTAVPAPGQGKVMFVQANPYRVNLPSDVKWDGQTVATLQFRENTGYFNTTSLTHSVEFSDPIAYLITGWKVQDGAAYTVIATSLDSLLGFNYSVLTDDLSAPESGKAKIRYYNAAPDLWHYFDGVVHDNSVSVGTFAGYIFADRAFRDFTEFVQLPAGTYSFDVISDSTFMPVDSLPNVTLQDGKIYTMITTGSHNGSSQPIQTKLIQHN